MVFGFVMILGGWGVAQNAGYMLIRNFGYIGMAIGVGLLVFRRRKPKENKDENE